MGRQKGEAARSKARPSSSSLAASLLPSGATSVGFGGYVGSSRLDASQSIPQAASLLDIDGEVAQHLKRLARKDPTTKLKALTSLSMLLKQKSPKEILPIIPQWAFEYRKLLLDYNREVRRATHDTMTDLVTVVGRDLALHLKSLMGPWWYSQFDPVNDVSQAAKRSLQAAFPVQEKRLDALMLCTTEVFMYLEENLKLTPQSMSDKAVAFDEVEEMHHQVISSSLLALATLVDILLCFHFDRPGFQNTTPEPKHVSKARETAISYAENLFANHKLFLDFLRSPSPAIRSATYTVLRSYIKNIPQVINDDNINTLSGAILGAFQDKDPACHLSMWEAILLFSKKFPDRWTTLSQKTLLNRLWQFLRNGCFGSQQVSYPVLVRFLDSLPPKAITGEKFFLEFFQNLWAGRSLSHSIKAYWLALFLAFRECYLWGLKNASRCFDGTDAIDHFRYTLVEKILLKLVWHDYLTFSSPNYQDRVISWNSQDLPGVGIEPFPKQSMEALDINYPMDFMQDFGKCIVEILSGIYSLKPDLLLLFCATFEDNCMDIFKQTENNRNPENVERIIKFLLLLDEHAVQKGETWPLVHLVGPMLAKSFQLIKALDSVYTVRVLEVAVSIFGPRQIIRELVWVESSNYGHQCDESTKELDLEQFLQVFKEIFVPWCLQEYISSTSARLDLLMALLDNECFSQQWNIILTHATNLEPFGACPPRAQDSNYISVLALLVEKISEVYRKRKVGLDLNYQQGSCTGDWQHELLDSIAVDVVRSYPPFGTSDARFLCAVLGDSVMEGQTAFLTRDTSLLIFDEVLRKLLTFIKYSTFISVRYVWNLLTVKRNDIKPGFESSVDVLAMAQFSLEVLEGSFFGLNSFCEESGLVPGILATIFVIDWESSMATVFSDELDDESMQNVKARLNFCESVHAFRCKIKYRFFRSLSMNSQQRLQSILVQFIKCALFKEVKLETDQITSLCCVWMLEVLESLCQDQCEEQKLLEQFVSEGDSWSLWVMPDISSGERSASLKAENFSANELNNFKFVALVDKLISKIGIDRVFAGPVSLAPSLCKEPKQELMASRSYYPHAWLAAEILCTWKWPGGSALSSFLPLLTAYAEREINSPESYFLDSIVNILLDGALVQGGGGELSLSKLWPASCKELESIKEPYLRALLSLLVILYENNIWGTEKATLYFKMLVNRLFIGEAVNTNCLKILAPIMTVLIRPLSFLYDESMVNVKTDSFGDFQIHCTIEDWLRRTLSLSSLSAWQAGKDMDDWLQLVISCYPLKTVGSVQALKPERDISLVERALLIELFRKLRHVASASPAAKKLPMVQISLSKLIVVSVGYCWNEFKEDDWEFLLYQFRWWIESAVVMMEEVAENVNDAITDVSTSNNLEVTLNKLEQAVLVLNPVPMEYVRNALVSFSLFCGIFALHKTGDLGVADLDDATPLKSEKWGLIKDRILESILRLFFSTGVAEAIASSHCYEASLIIASTRLDHPHFWELVASHVIESSPHARDRAVKSVEMWGLSKGPISSLYAILFSPKPVPCLQFAAYTMLSSEPVSHLAFVKENISCFVDGSTTDDHNSSHLDMSSKDNVLLREEIFFMLRKSSCQILEIDLVEPQRVNVFLAWALFLSYLLSLPSSSPVRERLVQHIQDSANSTILDCLFQHIPLESCMHPSLKKRELSAGLAEVGTSATRAITTNSALFFVELLWPIGPEKMASLAGAIYGLMLCILPAYVREWFGNIRDRSTSYAIESFTKGCCSPPLITNELSQIKKANFSDENFSVGVSKSANEVVATYTKDETGMDLVIRLPASYPLRPVDVDCTRSLGISEIKQRKWLMSMMSFVRNQNGALAEAIRIWKSNFDKEFEGVEECPICYSVIHTANHSLPRLACKTCKHKFHSACLYKWFSTSHKSTCPLCQSPF